MDGLAGGTMQGANGLNGGGPTIGGGLATMEGRSAAFADGMHGGDVIGANTHPATSIQQQVQPAFNPQSVLALPNVIKNPNGMDAETYQKSLPMMSMMHNITAGPQSAGGANPIMNV